MDEEKKNKSAEESIGSVSPENEPEMSNAARRLRALGIDPNEEEHKNIPEETKPMKKAGKAIENFWYHYKTLTLALIAIVLVLGIGIYQLMSKTKPDLYIFYGGSMFNYDPSVVSTETFKDMTDAFTSIMDKDYNDDGEKNIMLAEAICFSESEIKKYEEMCEARGLSPAFNKTFNAEELDRFRNEMMVGESVIYLLDPALYEEVRGKDIFLTLEEALGYVPDCAYDEYGIKFAELEFAKYFTAFDELQEDVILAIRRVTPMDAFAKSRDIDKIHANHVDFFKRIVNFEYPEGYDPAE